MIPPFWPSLPSTSASGVSASSPLAAASTSLLVLSLSGFASAGSSILLLELLLSPLLLLTLSPALILSPGLLSDTGSLSLLPLAPASVEPSVFFLRPPNFLFGFVPLNSISFLGALSL